MNADKSQAKMLRSVRMLLAFFIVGLVVSGLTAIPLESEVKALAQIQRQFGILPESGATAWIYSIQNALTETNAKYPFMAYGTDWLAFAHLVIAIAFVGPLRDPVKNIWVIEFGMIACALVVPFALCMGGVRGIPMGWRLMDCSFGIVGAVPLWLCHRQIRRAIATKAPDV
jgi:hypothetical protein